MIVLPQQYQKSMKDKVITEWFITDILIKTHKFLISLTTYRSKECEGKCAFALFVKGVAGEEANLELHRQEVRKVQRLKDIKETWQQTKASKVNDLQEAVKQDPPCSSDKLYDHMPHN